MSSKFLFSLEIIFLFISLKNFTNSSFDFLSLDEINFVFSSSSVSFDSREFELIFWSSSGSLIGVFNSLSSKHLFSCIY